MICYRNGIYHVEDPQLIKLLLGSPTNLSMALFDIQCTTLQFSHMTRPWHKTTKWRSKNSSVMLNLYVRIFAVPHIPDHPSFQIGTNLSIHIHFCITYMYIEEYFINWNREQQISYSYIWVFLFQSISVHFFGIIPWNSREKDVLLFCHVI